MIIVKKKTFVLVIYIYNYLKKKLKNKNYISFKVFQCVVSLCILQVVLYFDEPTQGQAENNVNNN